MIRTKILGLGSYVPDRVVTNEEISFLNDQHIRQETQQTETTDEWIQRRTGIKERRYVPRESGMATSDLALQAAKRALLEPKPEARPKPSQGQSKPRPQQARGGDGEKRGGGPRRDDRRPGGGKPHGGGKPQQPARPEKKPFNNPFAALTGLKND